MQCYFELVFGPGRNRTVRALVLQRKFRAEPLPEDADNEITIGRGNDLILKGLVGRVEFFLPAEEFEMGRCDLLLVEPVDDLSYDIALDINVARRGKENSVYRNHDDGLLSSLSVMVVFTRDLIPAFQPHLRHAKGEGT